MRCWRLVLSYNTFSRFDPSRISDSLFIMCRLPSNLSHIGMSLSHKCIIYEHHTTFISTNNWHFFHCPLQTLWSRNNWNHMSLLVLTLNLLTNLLLQTSTCEIGQRRHFPRQFYNCFSLHCEHWSPFDWAFVNKSKLPLKIRKTRLEFLKYWTNYW